MTKLELLSPARTADIGIEAIKHGADAVYIGAPRFGARAAAGNSVEDIGRLVRYAHQFGAKIYVTINTLLRDDELNDVQQLICQLYEINVDALIVQDLRLLSLDLPPIPLHASTQMDNQTPEHVQQLYDMGFRQVVLARELTIDQIRAIHQACPDMQLECFVHGALCVSLSGRCNVSEYLFGRSANRGECAQVCRMQFDLVAEQKQDGHTVEQTIVKGKHLLSLKDLCLIDHIQELVDAGVTSFKIEGRLKDMAYVKNVTAAYSLQLDRVVASSHSRFCRSSMGDVELLFTPDVHKSFNRGFTTYFLHGRTPDIFSLDTPKAVGEAVGMVKEVYNNSFSVAGLHQFANGDGLCFFDRQHQLHGFRLNKVVDGRLFPLDMPRGLQPKMRLFRNFDKRFDDQLQRESAVRTIPADMILGETSQGFRLTISDDYGHEAHYDAICDKSLARTHQRENIERQLSKLGDTPYRLRNLDIDFTKNWFIPASWLSEWRREVVKILMDKAGQTEAMHTARATSIQPSPQDLKSSKPQDLKNLKTQELKNSRPQDLKNLKTQDLKTPRPQDLKNSPTTPLMTCHHCIKYSLGQCRQPMPPLYLRLANGVKLHLDFDCRHCVMHVLRLLLPLLFLFSACTSQPADTSCDAFDTTAVVPTTAPTSLLYTDTLLLLTRSQADSLNFRLSHHYTLNYNFIVTSPSGLMLLPHTDPMGDTLILRKGDLIVVADINTSDPDTVWVKVARDQTTMGWTTEQQLMQATSPNDTISILIDRLARGRVWWMTILAIIGIALLAYRHMFRISLLQYSRHIDMLLPSLFLSITGVVACLYASIQMWIPEFWQEYYFHPTLNPFILPPLMAVLVSLVWLDIITYVAVLTEACRRLYPLQALLYVLELSGLALVVYLLIYHSTHIYLGYLLLPLLIAWLIVYTIRSTKILLNH